MPKTFRVSRVFERRSKRSSASFSKRGTPARVPGARAYHSGETGPTPRSQIFAHERALRELLQRYEKAYTASDREQIIESALSHIRGINETRASMLDGEMPHAARLRDYWVGAALPREFRQRDDAPSANRLMRAVRERVEGDKKRAESEAVLEAAARREPIDFGENRREHWELLKKRRQGPSEERITGSVNQFLELYRNWMRRHDVPRAGEFLVHIQGLALKLPSMKKRELFRKLAEESDARANEFEKKNDTENWALFTLFAEQNRAAQKEDATVLSLIQKGRGISDIRANLQRRTLEKMVKIVQPSEKEETRVIIQELLQTVPTKLVRVLAARVNALAKTTKTSARAEKRLPVVRATISRASENIKPVELRARPALTLEEKLLMRMSELHPADQRACRQYVSVANEAAQKYFRSMRQRKKSDAKRFLAVQDAAMVMFWQTLGLKPPVFR